MTLLLDDIGLLLTCDPAVGSGPLGTLPDAAVVVDGGRVAWVGPAASAPACDRRLAAAGGCVLPGFVDSHTHLVFAGDRVGEFTARMAGRPYAAGGIAATVAATRAAETGALRAAVRRLAAQALANGTTTLEVKSGYGLTVPDERRCLQLGGELTPETTFLGAHVVPPEYADRPDDYVALVAGPMLAACAPLARWADVFCDEGAFDADQARTVLAAAAGHGLGLRLHAGQLREGPGVALGVELGAASVDHCTRLSAADVDALAGSSTVATLLPAAEFATRSRYADGRRLVDAGVTVAVASDCNPGTAYTTSLPFCIALAVRECGLTPDEAVWAATAGGARALRRTDIGRLSPGAAADAIVLDTPSHLHIPYRAGDLVIKAVLRGGQVVAGALG